MQCYHCGEMIPAEKTSCPACGSPRSRLIYVPLWGVIGGIIGSLLGFTFFSMAGALAGGLVGIIVCEVAARLRLRASSKA